jgi:hypothetical protein
LHVQLAEPSRAGTLEPVKRSEMEVCPTEPIPDRLIPVESFLDYVADHQQKMALYHDEFRVGLQKDMNTARGIFSGFLVYSPKIRELLHEMSWKHKKFGEIVRS